MKELENGRNCSKFDTYNKKRELHKDAVLFQGIGLVS